MQKRQVETLQVVILDHVRICRAHLRDKPADQLGLGGISLSAGLEQFRCSRPVAYRDHEDPVARGIEPRGFQIELHPVQLVERQIVEVSTPRRDAVLLLRRQYQDGVLSQISQWPTRLPSRIAAPSKTAAASALPSPALTRYRSVPGPSSSR